MIGRRATVVLPLLLVLAASTPARPGSAIAPPDGPWLLDQVRTLAAPEMEGRAAGTSGGERAARHLAEALAGLGLRPAGDDGTYFQWFPVATGTRLAPGNLLVAGGEALAVGRDWMPHGGSPAGEVDGQPGPDIALVGPAGGEGGTAPSRLERLVAAWEAGARAVLLVEDPLPGLDVTATRVAVPSASVTAAAAARLRAAGRARLRIALEGEERRAANVLGILPGSDPGRAGEAVVVGAHYDHLGRAGGALHPGADDNASGTAVALGLARAFVAAGPAPRTLVFAFFAAEELGLLGAAHYVGRPAMPLERTVAMVNLDMVGRLRDGRLHVGGVESGTTLRGLLADAAAGTGLDLRLTDTPFAPSDHLRFYRAGVPVLFLTTGRHPDYHRPTDTADRVSADGLARVAALATRVVERLAGRPRPAWVRLDPPPRSGGPASGSAFLGIVADARAPGEGVRVAEVLPRTAAAGLGLAAGDVIFRLGDRTVRTFEDLRQALGAGRPGQPVVVTYLRDGRVHRAAGALGAAP